MTTPTRHVRFVIQGDDVFDVQAVKGSTRPRFVIDHHNRATGYRATYDGAGARWKRTTRTRTGRSIDYVASKALIEQLRSVTEGEGP